MPKSNDNNIIFRTTTTELAVKTVSKIVDHAKNRFHVRDSLKPPPIIQVSDLANEILNLRSLWLSWLSWLLIHSWQS